MVAVTLSLIITRVATIALSHTGMSQEAARFQARSAFTGTGFTTHEAESVVNHPVRRRIITLLMILRSAGLVTILISLILSFVGSDGGVNRMVRLLILAGSLVILWLLSQTKKVDRFLNRIIKKALKKWTDLEVYDYGGLLRLSGQYSVTELKIDEGDWIEGKMLRECYLKEEGITVLGITRSDGTYIGGPNGDTEVFPGDTVVLYGKAEILGNLVKRRDNPEGEKAHQEAVEKHQEHQESEKQKDEEFVGRKKAQEAEDEETKS